MAHLFLLKTGVWLGEGKITFTKSPEKIKFYARWQIFQPPGKLLQATQTVEMEGVKDHVINFYEISDIKSESFQIHLENDQIGKISGKGLMDSKIIAWEFRGLSELEGFEVYEIQENGDYSFRAEYTSPDEYRTIIEGLIWKKEMS